MRKILVTLVMLLLFTNIAALSLVKAVTPHETAMDTAITNGIAYLNSLQQIDGHVGDNYYVGETALYVLALLDHNVSVTDPHVQSALTYILSYVQADGSIYTGDEINYQTACSIMALEACKNSSYLQIIKNAAAYILTCQAPDGSFGYEAGATSGDVSNSQYSILGLKSAEVAGWIPPSLTPYIKLANFVKTQQNADGGYGAYGYPSSGAGTSAALVCLVFGGVPVNDPSVRGGINWLNGSYSYTTNPGYDWLGAYYYYLYGATKALTFCGITNEVGGLMDPTTATYPGNASDRGWYFDFTEYLIENQALNGDFPPADFFAGHIIEDILAVLVLERAVVVAPPRIVGGEIVPVNVLQLLTPYLLVALFAAAALGSILRFKRKPI